MVFKKLFVFGFLLLGNVTIIRSNGLPFLKQQQPIYLLASENPNYETLKDSFDTFGVEFEEVDSIVPNVNNLYVIFNLQDIALQNLPQYFIAYQTLDLTRENAPTDYLQKLSQAIAVWDPSKNNIERYSSLIHHYYYLPKNYQFTDPVILSCLLPISSLPAYRALLAYSNAQESDISSHLPTIFCYTVLQNPHLIVEAGVRDGESTIVFRKALNYVNAQLIGIDIDPSSANVYNTINNAHFLLMDDRNFDSYYSKSDFKETPIDIIFIDTSHTYLHTMQEIALFEKYLPENGIMLFHDSNVTPLNNGASWETFNGTFGNFTGNTRGVTQALKEYFSFSFDEYQYCNQQFSANGSDWHITHYPFCNGLTVIRLLKRNALNY